MRPVLVSVTLPHTALPLADWADCYRLRVAGHGLTAEAAARQVISGFPWWVDALMRIRNRIVGLFGLKPAAPDAGDGADMIAIFPIVRNTPSQVVLGFDDRHLDFRVVIDVADDGPDWQTVSVSTLVWRKILLGRLYIAVITPFHKLIVSTALASLATRDAVTRWQ
ncbi:DUF2867 domain-containing protein [Rhizobium sp. CG5]|nr:DUF2867 domain-containing protein [Rhizobium sp. CG5]